MRDPIAAAISRAIGRQVHDDPVPVGGGLIHAAFAYRTDRAQVFVKVCSLESADMLAAEADGLRELATAKAIRIPEVLALGKLEDRAFLCLEWLDLQQPSAVAEARLGERLAALHAHTSAEHGWHRANFIGLTRQHNDVGADWVAFYRSQRLEPQLALAARNGADARTIEAGRVLCEQLGHFFSAYRPTPSLLHGDLWGGNWGAIGLAEPVIFDPAVYYGDRETDLAMTRLFGGFGPQFYAAYESAWALDADAGTRVPLYNLYHVLNHFNLFGGGYLSQARTIIDQLHAELK